MYTVRIAIIAALISVAACESARTSMPAKPATEPSPTTVAQIHDLAQAPTVATATDRTVESEPVEEAESIVVNAISSRSLQRHGEIARLSGVTCQNPDLGLGCETSVGDGENYEVKLFSSCSRTDSFAYVGIAEDTVLLDQVAPEYEASIIVAELSKGQVVCVRASAANALQSSDYYFVIAVPVESVASCAGETPCKRYGDRPITWHARRNGQDCKASGVDQFEGVCAAGWIKAAALEFQRARASVGQS